LRIRIAPPLAAAARRGVPGLVRRSRILERPFHPDQKNVAGERKFWRGKDGTGRDAQPREGEGKDLRKKGNQGRRESQGRHSADETDFDLFEDRGQASGSAIGTADRAAVPNRTAWKRQIWGVEDHAERLCRRRSLIISAVEFHIAFPPHLGNRRPGLVLRQHP